MTAPHRQDDGLLPVNTRVQQSGVYGGTRFGTVIKSNTDSFTIKWDIRTVACTYNRDALKGDVQCPITILDTCRDGAEGTADPLADLVSRFSKALLAKLKLAQANGRNGWERDDWEADCQRGLLRHVEKGDPRDVAAYCAFLWHHGWITTPPKPAPDALREAVEVFISTLRDNGLIVSRAAFDAVEKVRAALSPASVPTQRGDV